MILRGSMLIMDGRLRLRNQIKSFENVKKLNQNNKQMKHTTFLFLAVFIWNCSTREHGTEKPENSVQESIENFSVMSFNVLFSTSIPSTLETVRSTNADIIGLQEADEKRIKTVADSLGYFYQSFDKTAGNLSKDDTGILSRYRITKTFDDGVIIELPGQKEIGIFSVHLSPYPYEPYDFRDGKISTAKEAQLSASNTRLPEINPVLHTIDSLIHKGIPVFLTGDFNEPSHLDWSENAANNGRNFNKAVEWPCSKAVLDVGLEDSYRIQYPDEVNKNGITWTTRELENEVYDRIDFVYHHLQDTFKLVNSMRVGRPDNDCSMKVPGYESDHFAVLSLYQLNK